MSTHFRLGAIRGAGVYHSDTSFECLIPLFFRLGSSLALMGCRSHLTGNRIQGISGPVIKKRVLPGMIPWCLPSDRSGQYAVS